MKLVSIIIPAYNCEQDVRRCIDSLLKQTYKNIDITIYDDGSTDSTASICRKLSEDHSEVTFESVEHRGVADVRNYGLKRAKGDYIMFVDSDDYVKESYVEHMVSAIEEDPECDLAICSYDRIIYGGEYPIISLIKPGIMSRDQYLIGTLEDPGHHYFGVLWNKIFKRNIIIENGLEFQRDISLGEDFVFSLNYLKYAKKVNVINDILYYYCYQTRDTLSRIKDKSISDCRSELSNRNKIFINYVSVMKSSGLYNRYKKRIYDYWIVFLTRQKYSLITEYRWSPEDKKAWEREIVENSFIKKAISFYGQKEIAVKFFKYSITQTVKNIAKKTVLFFRIRRQEA